MAGEALSRTFLTVAFKKKQELEKRKLRERLHLQLQEDISRICADSLYCDLEVVLNSCVVHTHRSILQARSRNFFEHLWNSNCICETATGYSLKLTNVSDDVVKNFIKKIYCKCNITKDEESIIKYLKYKSSFEDLKDYPSPDSDVYLTPKNSPSQISPHEDNKYFLDVQDSGLIQNPEFYRSNKTHHKYYSIVPIDVDSCDSFTQSIECSDILEKELAEQDELLKSFNLIKNVNEKQKKLKKPTSLTVASSQTTKNQNFNCDNPKYKSNARLLSAESKSYTSPHKSKQSKSDKRLEESIVKEIINDQIDLKFQTSTSEDLSSSNIIEKRKIYNDCAVSEHSDGDDSSFTSSPVNIPDLVLACCKKDSSPIEEAALNCISEMDTSVCGAADSGVDVSSVTGLLGEDFSSPRDHTVSDTSGVDLTDDMLQDEGHGGTNLKSSGSSSSISSDAGTWDSTFPPTDNNHIVAKQFHDELCNNDRSLKINFENGRQLEEQGINSTNLTKVVDCFLSEGSLPSAETDGNKTSENRSPCNISEKLESKGNFHANSSFDYISENNVLCVGNSAETNSENHMNGFAEPVHTESLPCTDKTDVTSDVNKYNFNKKQFCFDSEQEIFNNEQRPKIKKEQYEWKIETANYFIDASTLVDENEIPMSPVSVTYVKVKDATKKSDFQVNLNQKEEKHVPSNSSSVNLADPFYMGIETSPECSLAASDTVTNVSSQVNSYVQSQTRTESPNDMSFKGTPFKAAKSLVNLPDSEDHTAEFETELKLIEHLEPQTIFRKCYDRKKRWDSCSAIEIPKNLQERSKEIDDVVQDAKLKRSLSEFHDTYLGSDIKKIKTNEGNNLKQLEKLTNGFCSNGKDFNIDYEHQNRDNIEKIDCASPSNKDEDNETSELPPRPPLIRRNTFELDPDDDHLALLRQEYERRQGNLIFQNNIPQFSQHLTGSEGAREGQSLPIQSSEDAVETNIVPCQSFTSSLSSCESLIPESSSLVSSIKQVLKSHSSFPSYESSNPTVQNTVKTSASFSTEGPLTNIFLSKQQMMNAISNQPINLLEQTFPSLDKGIHVSNPDYIGVANSEINDASKFWNSDPSVIQREDDEPSNVTDDHNLASIKSSTDAFTEDKFRIESPKRQKSLESVPILSGGVSATDFSVPLRKVKESPIMARRKNEFAPILSGAAPLFSDNETSKPEPKPPSNHSSGAAWVVDIGKASKYSIEVKKGKKDEFNSKDNRINVTSEAGKPPSVGYFVDLKDSFPLEHSKSSPDIGNKTKTSEKLSKNVCESESKTAGVGFFVTLDNESSIDKRKSKPVEKEVSTNNGEEAKPSCGFFVEFASGDVPAIPKKPIARRHSTDKEPLVVDKKSSIFSMFIDIGKSTNSTKDSVLNSRKSYSKAVYDSGSKISESPSPVNANMKDTSQDEKEVELREKKQPFYMFIENDSPVVKRKPLSGPKSNSCRHSWNAETQSITIDPVKPNCVSQHKRAHSISVDRSTISVSVEEKSTAVKTCTRLQSNGERAHEIHQVKQSGKIYNKTSERVIIKRALSDETNQQSNSDTEILKPHIIRESNKQSMVSDCAAPNSNRNSKIIQDKPDTFSNEIKTVPQKDIKNISSSTEQNYSQIKTSCNLKDEEKINDILVNIVDSKNTDSNNENVENSSAAKEPIAETDSFVKLSDLDKAPAKLIDSSDQDNTLPSFSPGTRMSRSIPETSWIESKLLMTRSTGSTSTKSLSRLYPHLHSAGNNSTSSPSSLIHAKSPSNTSAAHLDIDDNDTQMSETSDLSSMQSSIGPSGLEGSTEETDASSSYAGRSGPVSRLGEDLLRMFLEEINPDVTVEVGGRRMKAHKCILSSRCQYFAAMLSGGWVESAGNVISLQGFSYNAVHFALCHIYSGTSNIPDSISIVELATLADMLGLEGLKEVIMYTLKVKYCHFFHKPCTMCAVGVLECLPLAAAYGLDEIYRKSLRWITKYFVRIWPTKAFASLPRELIEKCYQQHVVHMSVDNVLETIMCCDKLLATLPNVRWAEPIFGVTSQLLEAAIKYMANNFSGVLASDNFLSLGKEMSWNISRLEDSLMMAADRLPPDQCCQSEARLLSVLSVVQSDDPPPEMNWSPNFIDLLSRLQQRVEASLIRQAPRAARCPSWCLMELETRKKIQEAACLVLAPSDEGPRSRHSSLARKSSGMTQSSDAYSTGPRSASRSRAYDLRQVRIAVSQQAKKGNSALKTHEIRVEKALPQIATQNRREILRVKVRPEESEKPNAGEETTGRPKTWPMRVLENKTKSSRGRTNSNTSSTGTPEKPHVGRTNKNLISSSDSSRTSSPAMRRSALSSESSGRSRSNTGGNAASKSVCSCSSSLARNSKLRQKKEGDITAISNDSLTDISTHDLKNGIKHQGKVCNGHRSDTLPTSVKLKVREEITVSSDSLCEHVTIKSTSREEFRAVASSQSSSITRPDTPKAIKKHSLGKLGMDSSMSTDSLATVESVSSVNVKKCENAKTAGRPGSSVASPLATNKFEGGKSVVANRILKGSPVTRPSSQQCSPAAAVRRFSGRQAVASPRDSPTARLKSANASSPYLSSPSLRRSLLLAAKTPSEISNGNINGKNVAIKNSPKTRGDKVQSKVGPSLSPSTITNRRTTRYSNSTQISSSPQKNVTEISKQTTSRNCQVRDVSTGGRSNCNVNKVNNNVSARKIISNGTVMNSKIKRGSDYAENTKCVNEKKCETTGERPRTVGSRSGTFLKDEPTVLKKPEVENVNE